MKIYRNVNKKKMICQWIPDRDWRGIAKDIKKIISIFKTWQKMVTKLGQFTKLGHFSFLNCPNIVTIFCPVLKTQIIVLDIPSNPPPIVVQNSLANQFFQKKMMILYIFNNKKVQNWREENGHFSFLNCPNLVTIFVKFWKWT